MLTSTRGVSLHAWKLFSKLLLSEDDEKTLGRYRFRQHICHPRDELRRYLEPMASISVEFITHLVISGGCDFTTHEMLCLAGIKNLGALEFIQPADDLRGVFPQVSDRLVRGWTETDEPFPLLRILRIWGDQSTTQESLQWVSKFPSLALYDVMGSREDWREAGSHAADQGWDLAEPVPGLENSLLRYLMLFAPVEESVGHGRLKDLARGIDSDLLSLCSDSQCTVKFVPEDQAPPLLNYLTDSAKMHMTPWDADAAVRDARACHGMPFEAWAFWLYAFIGQLSQNSDLQGHGLNLETQAVVGPFVLPSKPLASLFLGHSGRLGIADKPSYVSRGLFSTKRFTFTRLGATSRKKGSSAESGHTTKTNPVPPQRKPSILSMKRQKRKRLHDVLQALSG